MIGLQTPEQTTDTSPIPPGKPISLSILLIACGNSLRRDDGAGLWLAERLTHLWQTQGIPVRYEPVQQLTPELGSIMADRTITAVVFIDTRDATAEGGTPQVQIQAISSRIASPGLGHQLDPTTLLLYTHHLYHKQSPAWLITVPGVDFDHGEGFSLVAREALQVAEAHLAALIYLF